MSQPHPCVLSPSPSPAPGEAQPRGTRSAAPRRHFRCFDAMLDGPHPPDDITSCLCPAPWQGHAHRRPVRPDEAPPPGQQRPRPRRRVVLLKNSDPAVRRSIVLLPRALRSLRLFLDEVSELLRCHVHKLYTLEGRKIDSVQGLVHCPSVLVCVGEEPFRPFVLESSRKRSEDRLPRVPTKPCSFVGTDGLESRRSVNFGLETKKSIIHPRSDSAPRSARHSLSSEKSLPCGLNSTHPGNPGSSGTCQHVRESLAGDDIEKRVIVHKNGSVSVEMRVRFHLLNDETLQWSTEVKKSPGTQNLQQSNSESCSETDSISAYEAEDAYITKLYQRHLEDPHCLHCCTHCLEYQIWKSQMQVDQEAVGHIRSSSSSSSSHTVVCKRSSVDSTRTISRSSEEYMEQTVEEAEDGDTKVEYCTVSNYSHTQFCSVTATSKSQVATAEEAKRPGTAGSACSKSSQTDQVSLKITQVSDEDDRPLSAISHSSQPLEALQDYDSDLPPSISRASSSHHDNAEDDEGIRSVESDIFSPTVCKSASSVRHLTPRPPSKASACSAHSTRSFSAASSKSNVSANSKRSSCKSCGRAIPPQSVVSDIYGLEAMSPGDLRPEEQASMRGAQRTLSAASISARSSKSGQNQEDNMEDRPQSTLSVRTNASTKSNIAKNLDKNQEQSTDDRSPSARSARSNTSTRSRKSHRSETAGDDNEGKIEDTEPRAASAVSGKSNASTSSRKTEISEKAAELKAEQDWERQTRAPSALSINSHTSTRSRRSNVSDKPSEDRAPSTLSARSNTSSRTRKSETSEKPENESRGEELSQPRAPSTASHTSRRSRKSKMSEKVEDESDESGEDEENEFTDEKIENRSPSVLSAKSDISSSCMKSRISEKAELNAEEERQTRTPSTLSAGSCASPRFKKTNISEKPENESEEETEEIEHRAPSALSAKSSVSRRSTQYNESETKVEKNGEREENGEYLNREEEKMGLRPISALSGKSSISLRSTKSQILESGIEFTAEQEEDTETRAPSALSTKSNNSTRSRKSQVSKNADDQSMEESEVDHRAPSTLSVRSHRSTRSRKSEMSEKGGDEGREEKRRIPSPSALSAKSDISVGSRKSGISEKAPEMKAEEEEEREPRAPSTLSARSHTSTRSRKSKVSEEPENENQDKSEEIEHRAPSTLSVMSHRSTRSRKSEMSEKGGDQGEEGKGSATDFSEEETEYRSPSALSAKSDISARSRKSGIPEKAPEMKAEEEEEREPRAPSTLSARSHTSARSRKSKVSETAPDKNGEEEAYGADMDEEEDNMDGRPISALSGKSHISARSTKFKTSDFATEIKAEEEETENRSPSSLSAKSLNSARSRKSEASEKVEDENVGGEQAQDRAPSCLSAKSTTSTRSEKSKVSEEPENENQDKSEEIEHRAPSTLSVMSHRSRRSRKSEMSEKGGDQGEDGQESATDFSEIETEYRSPSALSAKSDISARSRKSGISEKAAELNAEEEEEREPRAPSTLSTKSHTSTRSRKSKVSEEAEEKNRAEERMQDRAPSSLSVRSNMSAKSNKSKLSNKAVDESREETSEHGAPSTLSVKSCALARSSKHTASRNASEENGAEEKNVSINVEEDPDIRAPSALSAKSNISTRSRSSKACEMKAEVNAGQAENRAPSAMSSSTNASEKSRKSNISNCRSCGRPITPQSVISNNCGCHIMEIVEQQEVYAPAVEGEDSGRSRMSRVHNDSADDPVAGVEGTEIRAPSTLSVRSNVSAKSKKSAASESQGTKQEEIEDKALRAASVLSKSSATLKAHKNGAGEDETENRARSAMSVISNTTVRSWTSKESEAPASENAKGVEKETQDGELSAASSDRECHACEKAPSSESVLCEVCAEQEGTETTQQRMGHEILPEHGPEHRAEAGKERVASGMSIKSKKNSQMQCSACERALTPTSTSVSIDLMDEQDAGEISGPTESAISVSSQTSAESSNSTSIPSGLSEKGPLTSYKSDMTDGNEAERKLDKTEDRPKSTASTRMGASDQNKTSEEGSHLNFDNDRVPSSMSKSSRDSVCRKSQNRDLRPSSKASNISMQFEKGDASNEARQEVLSRPVSSASVRSSTSKAKDTGNIASLMEDNTKLSIALSSLQVTEHDIKSEDKNEISSICSIKSSTSNKKSSPEISVLSRNQLSPYPPKGSPKRSRTPVGGLGTSNDSTRTQTDVLWDGGDNTRPDTAESKSNISDKTFNGATESSDCIRNTSGSRNSHRSRCSPCQKKAREEDMTVLVPSSLPNASPTEVVNEWLKKIPSDNSMYEVGDELNENSDIETEKMPNQIESAMESSNKELQKGTHEAAEELTCGGEVEPPEAEDKVSIHEETNKPSHKEPTATETPKTDLPPSPDKKCPTMEALPNSCHSSVQLMKVLLSPKLYRCNSLPEVSPVYGRKLSNSAKGLLDCLANLQLIDSGSADSNVKDGKYEELMNLLQSLWLTGPSNSEKLKKQRGKFKEQSAEDEITPRSSSGVDVSSGSAGSGKSSANGSVGQTQERQTAAEGRAKDQEDLFKLLEETEENADAGNSDVFTPKSVNESETIIMPDPATPDIASQVELAGITEMHAGEEKLEEEEGLASDKTIHSNETQRETPSSSHKSSTNDSKASKLQEGTEADLQVETSSGTPPSVPGPQAANKVSQDTDPAWVLKLLHKVEKQFMTHYVNAMTEFKTRWNLEDSEQLDTMIKELRDEVHKRIRSSIDRELKKIKGRAGKVPRPPKKATSRESSIQTELRRRKLKVMHNQSIDVQVSDEDFTATGTDLSDPMSEDEYCPCDTCMKKKMASKPAGPFEVTSSAPVMIDFDLRKILNLNKKIPTNIPEDQRTEKDAITCDLAEVDAMQAGKLNLEIVGKNEKEKERNVEEQNHVTVEPEAQKNVNVDEAVKYLEDSAGEVDASAVEEQEFDGFEEVNGKGVQGKPEDDEALEVKIEVPKVGNQEDAGREDDEKSQIDEVEVEHVDVNETAEDTEARMKVEFATAATEIEVAEDETTDEVAKVNEDEEDETAEMIVRECEETGANKDRMAEGSIAKVKDDGAEAEMAKEAKAKEDGAEGEMAKEAKAKEDGAEGEMAKEAKAKEDGAEGEMAKEAKAKEDGAEGEMAKEAKAKEDGTEGEMAKEAKAKEDGAEGEMAKEAKAKEDGTEGEMAKEAKAKEDGAEGEMAKEAKAKEDGAEGEMAKEAKAKEDGAEGEMAKEAKAKEDGAEGEMAKEELAEKVRNPEAAGHESEEDDKAGEDIAEGDAAKAKEDEQAEGELDEVIEYAAIKGDTDQSEDGETEKTEREATEDETAEEPAEGNDQAERDTTEGEEYETAAGDATEAKGSETGKGEIETDEDNTVKGDTAVDEEDETAESHVAGAEDVKTKGREISEEETTEAEENNAAEDLAEAKEDDPFDGCVVEDEKAKVAGDTAEQQGAEESKITEKGAGCKNEAEKLTESDAAATEEAEEAEGHTVESEDEMAEADGNIAEEYERAEDLAEAEEVEISEAVSESAREDDRAEDLAEAEEVEISEAVSESAREDDRAEDVAEGDEGEMAEGTAEEHEETEEETAEGETAAAEIDGPGNGGATEAVDVETAERATAGDEEYEAAEGDSTKEDERAEDVTDPKEGLRAEGNTAEKQTESKKTEKEANEEQSVVDVWDEDVAEPKEGKRAEGNTAEEQAEAQEETAKDGERAEAEVDEPAEGEMTEEHERAENVTDKGEGKMAEDGGNAEKQIEFKKTEAEAAEEQPAEEDERAEGGTNEAEEDKMEDVAEAEDIGRADKQKSKTTEEDGTAEADEDEMTKERETVAAAEAEALEVKNEKTTDGNVMEDDNNRKSDQSKIEVEESTFENTEDHDESSELKTEDEAEEEEEEDYSAEETEEDLREHIEDDEESTEEGVSAAVPDGVGSISPAEDKSVAEAAEAEPKDGEPAEAEGQEAGEGGAEEHCAAEDHSQELSGDGGAVELEEHMNALITRSPAASQSGSLGECTDRIRRQGSSRSSGLKAKQMCPSSSEEESKDTGLKLPPSTESPEKSSKSETADESDFEQDDFDF